MPLFTYRLFKIPLFASLNVFPFEISLYACCYPGPLRDPFVCLSFRVPTQNCLCMHLFYMFLFRKSSVYLNLLYIYLTSLRNSSECFFLLCRGFPLCARFNPFFFQRFHCMSRQTCPILDIPLEGNILTCFPLEIPLYASFYTFLV